MGVCKDKDEHKLMGLAVPGTSSRPMGLKEKLLDTSTLALGQKFYCLPMT